MPQSLSVCLDLTADQTGFAPQQQKACKLNRKWGSMIIEVTMVMDCGEISNE
jgi:hypothetical protein